MFPASLGPGSALGEKGEKNRRRRKKKNGQQSEPGGSLGGGGGGRGAGAWRYAFDASDPQSSN